VRQRVPYRAQLIAGENSVTRLGVTNFLHHEIAREAARRRKPPKASDD
jgi:hypothetical protein